MSTERRSVPNTLEGLRQIRDEIIATAARHGVLNLRIFGSVARGEVSAKSDVDFLVDLQSGRSLFDIGGLHMDLQDLLGRPVDVCVKVKPRIRERVIAEALPL